MKYLQTTLIVASTLIFVACGGDKNDTIQTMQTNTSYAIQSDKNITRTQPNTIIELETDISTGETTATLVEGGAKIE